MVTRRLQTGKKEVNKYRKLYQEALRNKLSQTETKLRK